VLTDLLRDRHFEFPVERAVLLTVLYRLMGSGSERCAEKWKQDYSIAGVDALALQQLYGALAWLEERLPEPEQKGATPFVTRTTTKDVIEEALWARRRHLFSGLDLVFSDTTSIYFEGQGGQTLGYYGHSQDHRPGPVAEGGGGGDGPAGNPVCSEMWPENASDPKNLVPIVERLQTRFPVGQVCIVADRARISAPTR
jgi:hypothetical protein